MHTEDIANTFFARTQSSQLIIVTNQQAAAVNADLYQIEKRDGKAVVIDSFPVNIGKNGFAAPGEKTEGDNKSPAGVFTLWYAFGYPAQVETGLPYMQLRDAHYWISDPNHPEYNRLVTGKTYARGAEKMLRDDQLYKYGIVISYNINPVIPGRGSGIFMHIRKDESTGTAGCVAMDEEKILQVLHWLDSANNPMILMGRGEQLSTIVEECCG